MTEKIGSPDRRQVIPLDEKIFDSLEEASLGIRDKEKQEMLEEGIIAGKKESFRFTENVLSKMLGEGSAFEEEEKAELLKGKGKYAEFSEENPSHDIINKFGVLSVMMEAVGILRDGWPKNHLESNQLIKRIALKYALDSALSFKKLVEGEDISAGEALKRLGLSEAVKPDFLQDKIIKRIESLPPVLKEHLFQ